MVHPAVEWLDEKPFEQQLVILALVLDPLGAATGVVVALSFEADPIMGGVLGLIAASMPMSLWIMRYAQRQNTQTTGN